MRDSDSSSGMEELHAPDLKGGGAWINSEPLTMAGLRGKIVLIDFWTYTCVNCLRTLPFLKEWHPKYAGNGLVIIGAHAPEFEFEKEYGNVLRFATISDECEIYAFTFGGCAP